MSGNMRHAIGGGRHRELWYPPGEVKLVIGGDECRIKRDKATKIEHVTGGETRQAS